MSKPASKTKILDDGLRYQSKVGGSPFQQVLNFNHSTMSCFLCGTHRVRTTMQTRKYLCKQQAVCAPSCSAAKEADIATKKQVQTAMIFDDNADTDKLICQNNIEGTSIMATAKKATPKAAATPVAKASQKVTKPAAKAAPKAAPTAAVKAPPQSNTAKMVAKISANIAKLTERKDAILAELKTLREKRAALKQAPVEASTPKITPAPVVAKAKTKAAPKAAAKAVAKSAAPAKVAKPVAKKK
jgi:hypothetical protein